MVEHKCPPKCEECPDKDQCDGYKMMKMGLARGFSLEGLGNLGGLGATLFSPGGFMGGDILIDLTDLPNRENDPEGFEAAIAKALEEKGFPPEMAQAIGQQLKNSQEENHGEIPDEMEDLGKIKKSILKKLQERGVPPQFAEEMAQQMADQMMGGLGGIPDGIMLTTIHVGSAPSQMTGRRKPDMRMLVENASADDLLIEGEDICTERALALLSFVKDQLRKRPQALGDLAAGIRAFNLYVGFPEINASISPAALEKAINMVNSESADTKYYFTQKSSRGREGDIKEVGIQLSNRKKREVRQRC